MSAQGHASAARKLLAKAEEASHGPDEEAWVLIARAQTHATLAMVEQLQDMTLILKVKR